MDRFATFENSDVLHFEQPTTSATPGERFAGLERLPYHEAKRSLIDEFHREVLPRVVQRNGGSMARAADQLGLPRASLYRMMQHLRGPETESHHE